MKMSIQLENIGRSTFNAIWSENINTNSLQEAIETCEVKAFEEVQKFLLSSIVNLVPNEEDYLDMNTYDVCVGDFGRVVGKVIIRKLAEETP